jgi:hypothetical protein
VAFIVVNTSGLQDINRVSGAGRQSSTNAYEIDIRGLPEVLTNLTDFLDERNDHVRYETRAEVAALNSQVESPIAHLNTFSFDVGRDQVFLNSASPGLNWWTYIDPTRPPPSLGTREAADYLHDKFNINSITNYDSYYDLGNPAAYSGDPLFLSEYFTPLEAMLTLAGMERPDDVAWNIVNYLDPDRLPQGATTDPWTHTEGGEAIPLINEIVVTDVELPTGGTGYVAAVELWYPFAPITVEESDNFTLEVGIFRHQENASAQIPIMDAAYPLWSFTVAITNMQYGTNTEFLVYSNSAAQTIIFPTNSTTGGKPALIGSLDPDTGSNNVIWFLARVLKDDGSGPYPVDESMGYQSGVQARHKRALFLFDRTQGFSVNDPRANGQVKYWWNPGDSSSVDPYGSGPFPANIGGVNYPAHDPTYNTLGRTNQNCDPWSFKGHGVPIYATNGVMRNIGELGHIYRSNLDNPAEEPNPNYWWWRNINLMRSDEGTMLMDMMTVRSANRPYSGLFSINTRQWHALATAFTNLSIGLPGITGADAYPLDGGNVADLVDEIIDADCVSFTDLFDAVDGFSGGGGPIADAFRECAPNGEDSSDIYKEDTFRHIAELVTFRQNLFTVVMIAQAFAPQGDVVVAERRAVATIYRDAYTGRHFTRSFKWLTD